MLKAMSLCLIDFVLQNHLLIKYASKTIKYYYIQHADSAQLIGNSTYTLCIKDART